MIVNNGGLEINKVQLLADGRVDSRNASLYIGLKEKTLAMMRSQGRGPKFIKRGRVFYFLSDLDLWLSAGGKCNSTTQARCDLK